MSTDNGGESDRLIGQGLALSLFRTFLGSGLFGAFSRSGGGLALVDGFVGRRRLLSGRRFLGGGLLGRSLLSRSLLRGSLRSDEHTSELQSLMRISYDVSFLQTKNTLNNITHSIT